MKRSILPFLLLPVLLPVLAGVGLPLARAGEAEDFQYALALMGEREEFTQAAEKFEEFARKNPSHALAPKALYYLGGCYTRLKKDATAAETYLQLVKLYPQADAVMRQEALSFGGDAWFRAGRFDRAAQMYSDLLTAYPAGPFTEMGLYWRAECRARLAAAEGQKESSKDALADFGAFLEKFPASKMRADALCSAGYCAYDAKDYLRAQDFFTRFAREFPQDVRLEEALYHAADSRYWQEDYVGARTGFSDQLKRFPEGKFAADARSGLGWCSYAKQEFAQAGTEFAQAALLQKDRSAAIAAHYDAGVAYEQATDDTAAGKEFSLVADEAAHPRQARALAHLGGIARRAYLQNPQLSGSEGLAKAEGLLSRAFARIDECGTPDEAAGVVVQLGETRLDQARFAAAVEAFTVVPAKWPESRFAAYALYQLSLANAEQKKYTEAAEAIRALLKSYPASGLRLQAAYAMADYQTALGEIEKSRKAYQWIAEAGVRWAQDNPREGAAQEEQLARARDLAAKSLLRLGESYYTAGDAAGIAQAKEFFSRLSKEYPAGAHAPASCLRLGEISEKEGDFRAAADYYARAESLGGARLAEEKDTKRQIELTQVVAFGQYRSGVAQVLAAQKLPAGEERVQAFNRALGQVDSFLRSGGKQKENTSLAARARYYRAEALYALGRKAESAQEYQSAYDAETAGPLADAALFGLAWSRRDTGDTTGARTCMEELTRRFPASEYVPEALLLLAAIKRESGDLPGALQDAKQVTSRFSGMRFGGRAQAEEARILCALNRQEEAATQLADYITKNPQSPELAQLLYTQSWAYWGLSEPFFTKAAAKEKELQALTGGAEDAALTVEKRTQAAQLRKELSDARTSGRVHEDKMVTALERLAVAFPGFAALPEAALRMGEAAYDRGELDKAAEHYKTALSKGGEALADKARYRLAWCSLRASEKAAKTAAGTLRAQALENFATVCNDFPKSPLAGECAWRAGELLRGESNFSRALNLYEKAMERGGNEEVKLGAEYGRALCLLEMKRYADSLTAFKEFLKGHPASPLSHEANWGAGFAALNLGAATDARDYFNAAKEGDYNGEAAAKARYGLGMIALDEKNYRGAREEFRKVDVFLSQWQQVAALALLKAAEASRKLGEADAAAKDLELLLSRYAQSDQAAAARQMLTELKPATR